MHSHTRRAVTIAVVLLAVLTAGCGGEPRVQPRRERGPRRRLGRRRRALPPRRPGVAGPPRLRDRARARHDRGLAAPPRSGAHLRGARPARRSAARVPPRQRVRSAEPPGRRPRCTELERRIRDQAEAAQPRSNINQLRENARQSGPPPLFNLTQVLPSIRFTNASLRDILGSIGMSAGINVTFDNTFQDRQVPRSRWTTPRSKRRCRRSRRPTSCSTRCSRRASSSSSPTTSRSAPSTKSRSSARSSSRTPTPPSWRRR